MEWNSNIWRQAHPYDPIWLSFLWSIYYILSIKETPRKIPNFKTVSLIFQQQPGISHCHVWGLKGSMESKAAGLGDHSTCGRTLVDKTCPFGDSKRYWESPQESETYCPWFQDIAMEAMAHDETRNGDFRCQTIAGFPSASRGSLRPRWPNVVHRQRPCRGSLWDANLWCLVLGQFQRYCVIWKKHAWNHWVRVLSRSTLYRNIYILYIYVWRKLWVVHQWCSYFHKPSWMQGLKLPQWTPVMFPLWLSNLHRLMYGIVTVFVVQLGTNRSSQARPTKLIQHN